MVQEQQPVATTNLSVSDNVMANFVRLHAHASHLEETCQKIPDTVWVQRLHTAVESDNLDHITNLVFTLIFRHIYSDESVSLVSMYVVSQLFS